MTTDRNKLLELAKEAGAFEGLNDDDMVFPDDGSLERFAALLQAQGEPVSAELESMKRMFHAACSDLGAINEALGLDPDDGGAEPILDAIAELMASSDQVWNEACEAAAKAITEHDREGREWIPGSLWDQLSGEAAARIRSLKRPSQAQEPNCRACNGNDADMPCAYPGEGAAGCLRDQRLAVSGAVDELPPLPEPFSDSVPLAWAYDKPCFDPIPDLFTALEMRAYARLALSRAQATQPARQAPAVSDAQIKELAAEHGGWEPSIWDGPMQFHTGEPGLLSFARALLSQPAAAPVSEQAVPEGYKLVPTDTNSVVNMGWAYLDKAREESPLKEWAFSPAGFIAAINAAPSNQSQGGDKP